MRPTLQGGGGKRRIIRHASLAPSLGNPRMTTRTLSPGKPATRPKLFDDDIHMYKLRFIDMN
ncbi:hypothetical protein CO2235_180144 [Cupriavidus oxalaticus]|uniref:Uncharacterized protein n=1 Tax=Cupriavidus oxalaticus TaxID=96344 RepID=A0A375G5F2_9BURK|nr:hypothetical protein CO2235_180144 [Cupriavidus oxalaticus]